MGLRLIFSKSILLWMLLGFIKCQDQQNYFFTPSNQGQNRFVPSFQNSRTPNYLSGSRNSLTSAASTYPEQLIFLNNNNEDGQPQLTTGYSPFGQQLPLQKTTRNPDYYDISPRPFGSPTTGSQGFTRPKNLRSSSGFIPLSGHQIRSNVPHQQSQFLSHFSEPQNVPVNTPAAATSNYQSNRINAGGRPPFGSGAVSGGAVGSSSSNTSGFTRNRPFGVSQYNRQLQQQNNDELVTPPQQQLPFRNTRTRFQPSSAKTSSTTTTTSTSSTTSKPSRYNRFGGTRSSLTTPSGSSEIRQTVGSALQTLPSRGRLPVTSVNKTLFQPRRPLIISRESNRPFGGIGNGGRITVNHNGSDKGSPNNTNSLEEEDDLEESVEEGSVAEEIRGENHVGQGTKEEVFEKLSLHEAGASVAPSSSSPSTEQQSKGENNRVILTSNFYLPGNHNEEEEGGGEEELANHSGEEVEEVENSKEGSASKEHDHLPEYDYEYEDGKATSTQSAETELTEPSTEIEQNTEPKEQEAKSESSKTESSTEIEGGITDVTTMSSPESTAFYDEEEYEDGLGSGVDGSGVDGSGAEGSEENGHVVSDGSGEHETQEKEPVNEVLGREVVSVVTTKSVINGSTALPQPVTPSTTTTKEEEIYSENKLTPAKDDLQESDEAESAEEQNIQNTTESYVVIASIQTSRSINGARFLPFPAIEQEETKQTLSELERKIHGKNSRKKTQTSPNDSNETGSSGEMDDNPSSNSTVSSTAESPTADENEEDEEEEKKSVSVETTTPTTTTTTITTTAAPRFVPNIRKFMPKGSSKPKINIEDLPQDDLTGLLPPGFKPRASFKNKKLNKPTTTTPEPSTTLAEENRKPLRNSTTGRSFKNSPNAAQDVALAGLLPKGYRTTQVPAASTEPPTKKIEDLLGKLKFEDDVDKLVPADYKAKGTTPKPSVTVVDDISKFLPPGFKLPPTTATSTTSKPVIKVADDISKFLPPGFKPQPEDDKPDLKVAVADDISKFLPPGFKLEKEPKEEPFDISKLLPKDYKPLAKEPTVSKKNESTKASEPSTTEKTSTTNSAPTTTTAAPAGGLKVVFPKGFHNKRPGQRITTPHSGEVGGPTQPSIVIKKGPPTRATTEFTGWPTPSTTPISIEKLLEQAKTATVDISDLLPQTSTMSTTTTSSTTTTTPEPPRPTKPGHCKSDCDLAGTIKIIDGVSWKPELLDHNTVEWKNLAREVEAQLNEVYSNAPHLGQWYKKVRIDSFSKGSVLVDYFVELGNITQDVDTLEIKKLFHQALTQPPLPVVPLQPEVDNENDTLNASHEGKGEKLVKETYLMGRFVVDPSSTDFIVIPKSFAPTVEFAEDEALIPHWAIVLIVIGIGSLCFVVIFGVTVLINRQKNSKKTPMPLTADMMNDLKVNHMGGADNYGVDDFYNIDDAWNDTKQPIKPKRFTNSMHGSSASNIYDSWRSTRHGDYYYDSHNYTPHNKADQYPSDAFADVHQMYTYNNPRSRYQRDYDPDF